MQAAHVDVIQVRELRAGSPLSHRTFLSATVQLKYHYITICQDTLDVMMQQQK